MSIHRQTEPFHQYFLPRRGSPLLRTLLTGTLSFLGLLTGWQGFQHRYSGFWEAAGFLLVARPDRVLVDERSESGSRRNSLGDVVWRRKVLGGEQAY